ncbi:MAG: DUF3019 domain-containing protein [Colwellia sp.]|nr:DUF3019 domain-containing protein [Colwellia sp.]
MPCLLVSISLLLPMPLKAASISDELLKASPVNVKKIKTEQVKVQSVKLTVSPKQCIAMQQGQSCYLQVNVTFQANILDDYCLYLSTQPTALQCWKKVKQAEYSYAFDSNIDVEFFIKTQAKMPKQANLLAQAKVKIAWVHEKKGKPRMSWRLF